MNVREYMDNAIRQTQQQNPGLGDAMKWMHCRPWGATVSVSKGALKELRKRSRRGASFRVR